MVYGSKQKVFELHSSSATPGVAPEGESVGVGISLKTGLLVILWLYHIADSEIPPCTPSGDIDCHELLLSKAVSSIRWDLPPSFYS